MSEEKNQGEPVAAFKNCIDARAYIADLFKQHLRRHDFNQYITERLAGDFAFALANWLAGGGIADPGVVEQLRAELAGTIAESQRRRDCCADLIEERDTLRIELAKALALLELAQEHCPKDLRYDIEDYLNDAQKKAPGDGG